MQSIKGVLLLLTLCLCVSGIWSRSSLDVFDSVWEDLEDKGKTIVDGLRVAGGDGATKGSELLCKLHGIKGNFLADLTQLGQNMSTAITKAVVTGLADLAQTFSDNISALKAKVDAERNIIKKKALITGLAALEKLVSVTYELQSVFSDINEKLGEKINSQLNELLDDLLRWGEEQLKRVENETNGVGLPEASALVEALIKQFTESLVNTLTELEFKKSLIEQELNDKINEYTGYVNDLIATMNGSKILDILQFKNRIEELVENLSDAHDELHGLIEKGKGLLNDGLFACDSFNALLSELVSDAHELEKYLNEIIAKSLPSTNEGGC